MLFEPLLCRYRACFAFPRSINRKPNGHDSQRETLNEQRRKWQLNAGITIIIAMLMMMHRHSNRSGSTCHPRAKLFPTSPCAAFASLILWKRKRRIKVPSEPQVKRRQVPKCDPALNKRAIHRSLRFKKKNSKHLTSLNNNKKKSSRLVFLFFFF